MVYLGNPALGLSPAYSGKGFPAYKYFGIIYGGFSLKLPLVPNSAGSVFAGPSYMGSNINIAVSGSSVVIDAESISFFYILLTLYFF